jgi:hypothetical protein
MEALLPIFPTFRVRIIKSKIYEISQLMSTTLITGASSGVVRGFHKTLATYYKTI